MRFEELLEIVAEEPLFETGLLLAGERDPADVRRQLSRWVEAGRIFRLRRGLYSLAPPFRKVAPHPFVIANHLQPGSYVSLQAALGYFGLIPEHVPVVTGVGAGRTRRWETPLGIFDFRHLRDDLVKGFSWTAVGNRQRAFVATPEKALLDLAYLEPGGDSPEYLSELRLQNLERIDVDELLRLASELRKPKLERAAAIITDLAREEAEAYETL